MLVLGSIPYLLGVCMGENKAVCEVGMAIRLGGSVWSLLVLLGAAKFWWRGRGFY